MSEYTDTLFANAALGQAQASLRGAEAQHTNANANMQMAQPGMQQGNISYAKSGQEYLPWQEQLAQQYGGVMTDMLGRLGGRLDSIDQSGTPGTAGQDYGQYMSEVTGSMPGAQFSDVPIEDVLTPSMLNQQMNNLFAGAQAGGAAQLMGAFNARPGMGMSQSQLANQAAGIEAATRGQIASEFANKIPSLMFDNQAQRQQAMALRTQAENARAGNALKQGELASGLRAQDISREGNLLQSLNQGFSGGGFLGPLSKSESSSVSGPVGFLDFGNYDSGSDNRGSRIGGIRYSDRRLKSNVTKIGSYNGLGIYEYDFNGERDQGVMADEVLKVNPAAVSYDRNGYAMVDYSML